MRNAQPKLVAALWVVLLLVCLGTPRQAGAQDIDYDAWLAANAHQGTIEPGTKITLSNWRQYKDFMPPGMQALFEGKYFWKMPPDVVMEVGPTIIHPLPKRYLAATEKYSKQVSVVHLPNGRYDVANYHGGMPFPNPQEPDKGYKILANEWFAYLPHLYVNTPENMARTCTQDRFHNISCIDLDFVYRQLDYNTDPNTPVTEPGAAGVWYSEWLMVETPEQSKYTANLTLWFKDNQRFPDTYVFVPALRRSLRLSVTARCAPVLGTDFVQDDYNTKGFNGGVALFTANFLGHRKILAFVDDHAVTTGNFPANWDMPLGWPRPSWGKWQLREVDIIDIRRIPSERPGYCYGKKVGYIDSHFYYGDWFETFDSNMKLWKLSFISPHAVKVPGIGLVTTNSVVASAWDIQNAHMTTFSSIDKYGHDVLFNEDAPKQYHDLSRYCTPGGLMQIMK